MSNNQPATSGVVYLVCIKEKTLRRSMMTMEFELATYSQSYLTPVGTFPSDHPALRLKSHGIPKKPSQGPFEGSPNTHLDPSQQQFSSSAISIASRSKGFTSLPSKVIKRHASIFGSFFTALKKKKRVGAKEGKLARRVSMADMMHYGGRQERSGGYNGREEGRGESLKHRDGFRETNGYKMNHDGGITELDDIITSHYLSASATRAIIGGRNSVGTPPCTPTSPMGPPLSPITNSPDSATSSIRRRKIKRAQLLLHVTYQQVTTSNESRSTYQP